MSPPESEELASRIDGCRRKHAKWLGEIDEWRREHRRALDVLVDAQDYISRHDQELSNHAEAIRDHERAMEETLQEGSATEVPVELSAEHQRIQDRHDGVEEAHLRSQGRHRAMMDGILRLKVVLNKVRHGSGR
jgi:hypothetical protein